MWPKVVVSEVATQYTKSGFLLEKIQGGGKDNASLFLKQ